MIEYIKGTVESLTPTDAVIEAAGGVGYQLCISLATYSQLEGAASAKLFVHEVIREDAHTLYGFADERERSLFRALIGVSGVGAGTARIILSSIPAPELEQIIIGGHDTRLKAVKGIGAKTAQRIIVDLRDKIKPMGDMPLAAAGALAAAAPRSEAYEEALSALVMLGFTRPQSQKVLQKLFDSEPDMKVEAAIKKALSLL